jgi:hypothetical protein
MIHRASSDQKTINTSLHQLRRPSQPSTNNLSTAPPHSNCGQVDSASNKKLGKTVTYSNGHIPAVTGYLLTNCLEPTDLKALKG